MNDSASIKLAALLGCAALAAPLSLLAATSPSPEQYVNAAGNNSEWILPAKSYSGNRYVTASQITPRNVRQLKRIWKFKIDDNAGVETAPIVWNGMVYVTSAHDHVYALNAKTGKLAWEFKDNPHVLAFAANRGVGLMDGNVYVATLDGHLIALNAKTGKKVWDVTAAHDTSNTFYSMAPVPYHNAKTGKDMLLLGASNGDWGGIGYITAFDPKNGDRIWEWETIPGPGEPGHDSWSGDSWKRGGAAVWSGVAIDPQTDTLYMDLGNPQPDFLGTERKGSNLYSNSMVALDISGDKPTLKWYHQFIPHDTHDWDPAMPPVLFHGKVNGQDRALVAAGDKGGNFWILDAGTGDLVDHTVVSFQKGQNTEPSREGNIACPNTNGGIEFNGGSYDPGTNAFIVPSVNQCGRWKSHEQAVYIAGQFYLGGGFPELVGPSTGQLNAIDVSTGVFQWRHYYKLPSIAGVLTTKSGLAFTGELNGNFDAFEAKNGKLLWHYRTGSPIVAPPSAVEVGGKEVVLIASGKPSIGMSGVKELPKKDEGEMISAFALGK
ncbi:MAG: PQQ-binding-like beta-propeller repeat protein [Burkholderiales bacterium]